MASPSQPAPPLCLFLSMHHLVKPTHTQGFRFGLRAESACLYPKQGLSVQLMCVCVCGALLSCPGAMPKHISQGAIRNLITALNCSLSAFSLALGSRPLLPLFPPPSRSRLPPHFFSRLRLLLLSHTFPALAGLACRTFRDRS